MGTGAELDFAMDCAKSTRAKARSGVEVMPGGGTMVGGFGFQAGSPVRVHSPSVISSGWWTGLGSGLRSQSWIGGSVTNKNEHWRDVYGVYGLLKKKWSEL